MKNGSHIRVWRSCYYHHGIYVGTGQVVHYKSHGIVMTSLDDFAQGKPVEIVRHTDQNFHLTVSRAYQRLGENLYNLVFNNCESFASWCVYGKTNQNK